MKINGVSGYQKVEENFDIILSVDFGRKDAELYGLVSPTVFLTYDETGELKHSDICDEGLTTDLALEDYELNQLLAYVDGNRLKETLFSSTQEKKDNAIR